MTTSSTRPAEETAARARVTPEQTPSASPRSTNGRPQREETVILGVSAFFHDSAAVLLRGGEIIAAAQEERFTRIKHDPNYPEQAIAYCLAEAGLAATDLDTVVFYDKPLLKFERLIESFLEKVPGNLRNVLEATPVWLKEKLHVKKCVREHLNRLAGRKLKRTEVPQVLYSEHHQAHAASAFYPSPFERAAVLCVDGVGEWATTSAWIGDGARLDPLWQIDFPHSLGLLYSAFTYFCGFKVNFGEYKLMGLAPYGEPRYVGTILEHLVTVEDDGSFELNLDHFDFIGGRRMTSRSFDALFGGEPRAPESQVTQREMDIARSIQQVTEEIVLRLGRTVARETGEKKLCLAGGVALNCVANGRLLREGPFDEIWIQPAAGDAGGALGAAYLAHYQYEHRERPKPGRDAMAGTYLGPTYSSDEIEATLTSLGAVFERLSEERLLGAVVHALEEQKVVGWFQGRMEFGPRALGARSILGDPRSAAMQTTMNLKIKFRESFRPFAPSILAEHADEYFDLDGHPSPYMLLVAAVAESERLELQEQPQYQGLDRLKCRRSTIPAVTHVDGSARVQTVDRETSPRYHALLERFHAQTGCPLLINTSFNIRGEPIVRSPEDAVRCFMGTDMDVLALGDFLLFKQDQPESLKRDYRDQFDLD